MGGAIARGLCRGSMVPIEDIIVSNRSQAKLDALKGEYPQLNVTTNNVEASRYADVVILAVKPWLIEPVIKEIKPRQEQIVVSVAAGIDFAELDAMIGLPDMTLFRLIPNTAIRVMESMTLIASHNATPQQEQWMLGLFNEMGQARLLPENQMTAATAMTSCGIAYAFKYVQAVMQAGVELGIYPHDGVKMVAQSLKGAAEILLSEETHPSVEIDKVCTPGGYTIKGVNKLDEYGFTQALIEAVKVACK